MPEKTSAQLNIKQFGRFEVLRGNDPLEAKDWGRRKTQTLFKILLTERGRVFSQDQLTDALFPDLEPDNAVVNLRGRIGELRKALEPGLEKNTDSSYVLTADGGGYYLSESAPFLIDTEIFAQQLNEAQKAKQQSFWDQSLDHYQAVIDLYRGVYLEEDLYEEWSLSSREHFQERYELALESLAECHAKMGNYVQAVEACQQALKLVPLRENLYRHLMRYHYQLGEQSEAIQTFETCQAIFDEKLSTTPSIETVELYEQILNKTLVLESDEAAKSIAVLPFENLSEDDDYFSDGLTEDIITQLCKIRDLKVISRTSVMPYKNSDTPLRDIGKRLRVAHLLKGSVRQAGQQVRVVSQLIHSESEEQVWAETYDHELIDIFNVQSEVAQEIANALRAQITDTEKAQINLAPTENMEAYQLYLKGRFYLNLGTLDSYQKAVGFFQQAVELDEKFALGFAGLAAVYDALTFFSFMPPQEGYLKAKEVSLRALEIDDHLGEAHAALANVKLFFEWDWQGAEAALEKAVTLNPGFATAHAQYSRLLLYQSKFDEAYDYLRKGQELDPLSQNMSRDVGYFFLFSNRYDEGIDHLNTVLEMFPHDRYMYFLLGLSYLGKQQIDQALGSFQKSENAAAGLDPYLSMYLTSSRGIAYAKSGNISQAQEMLDTLMESQIERDRASVIATLAFALGKLDQGFEWLEQAFKHRDPWLCHLNIWPLVDDSIRKDKKFIELLQRIGLD